MNPADKNTYTPNDSPFGDAFRAFAENPDIMEDFDTDALDEYLSICHSYLSRPYYMDDENLHRFSDAIAAVLNRRF